MAVELVTHPACAGLFRTALLDNARTSRGRGGRPSDVRAAMITMVIVHRVYDERVAFDAHAASAHVRAFDERVRDRVARKTNPIGERVDP